MLPQIWKRLGAIMTPDFFYLFFLLFIIIKFLVDSGKYYNVYSDINVICCAIHTNRSRLSCNSFAFLHRSCGEDFHRFWAYNAA